MQQNEWHYTNLQDQDVGPVSVTDMRVVYQKGELTLNSYVWHPVDCNAWTELSQVPNLLALIKPAPPAVPSGRKPPAPPRSQPMPPQSGGSLPRNAMDNNTNPAPRPSIANSLQQQLQKQIQGGAKGNLRPVANNEAVKRNSLANHPNVLAAASASANRRSMQRKNSNSNNIAIPGRPTAPLPRTQPVTASATTPARPAVNRPVSTRPQKSTPQSGDVEPDTFSNGITGGKGTNRVLMGRIKLQGRVVGDWMELQTTDGVPYFMNQRDGSLSWEKPDAMKDSAELATESGNWVWFPDEVMGYVPALVIQTRPDGRVEVELQHGDRAVTKRGQHVFPLNKSSLKRLEKDLVLLDSLDEGLILYNLRERFLQNQQIYTNIGTILVSINPYETHPIYNVDKIWEYRNRGQRVLEPHVYQVADEALVPLLEYGENHSILISGESGAGKTWNTKQCLSYLTEVTSKGKGGEQGIEAKILAANPILEAFGNAKTVRNDNSSRFGRFTEVHFENTGKIHGARIDNFLLEKSRVVWQQQGERNYHVFYQLLNSVWKESYALSRAEDYNYLNQSGCLTVDDVDDAHDFEILLQAFNDLNFKQEEIVWIFELIAAVLQLGNITFISDGEEGSQLSQQAHTSMQYIVQLLHVNEKDLHHALTHRSIEVRGTVTHIPLKPDLAQDSRDALSKSVYSQLFDWLVSRINSSLMGAAQPWALIGLLDIFGFEIFELNSFEQLCINFTNEKLQQLFNRDTFKKEEAMYKTEGVAFQHIKYVDNQPILDMIEKAPVGLLLMLDDMNRMPRSTDEGFVAKADQGHSNNPFYLTSTRTRQGNKRFTVCHYAGDVVYDSDGFLVKNKDLLYADLYEVMSKSTKKETAAMFPVITNSVRMRFSLGAQFRKQLDRLMGVLNATQTHYIRCIKPNSFKKARNIESNMVLEQLKYSGVFEAVRIRKQGFPFRYTYERFVERYKCLMSDGTRLIKPCSQTAKAQAKEILEFTDQDFSKVRFGVSMVLYRSPEHRLLELMRSLALERICGVIQALVRGVIARKFVGKCLAVRPKLEAAVQARELVALEAALGEYARIVGQYAGMVPADIGIVRKAKRVKYALVEWEKVSVELDQIVRLDVHNDNNAFESLKNAVWRAEELLDEPGTEWHQQMFEYSNGMFVEERALRLEPPLGEAVKLLERDLMTEIYAECKRLRFNDPRLTEIEKHMGMDEEELLKRQYKKAKALGLQDRAKNKEIEIRELFLDQHEEMFPFEHFPRLRLPEEYASYAMMFWKREEIAAGMLLWSKTPVKTSLTTLDSSQSKIAIKCHKAILGFCGDKNNPSPNSLAYEILQNGMTTDPQGDLIRDEIYCLIMKHLTRNESHQSISQAWKLLGLCIMNFPPGRDLLSYVHVYIRRNASVDRKEKFKQMLYDSEYAGVKSLPGPNIDAIAGIVASL